MNRRTFIHRTSHALAVPGLMSSLGFFSTQRLSAFLRLAEATDRVLVLIYLQGGNDGLNTVVPLDQLSALHSVRPQVVLPYEKLLQLNRTQLGLHPSLDGLRGLYNEGRLEIVQSVGYADQNYSHFRSTDIWMSGSDSKTLINSGWTGRYLHNEYPDFPQGYPNESATDPLAIELGYGSSMLFQGPTANMSMVISDPTSFYQLVDDLPADAPDTDAGDKLKYVQLTARQSQLYGKVVSQAALNISSQKGYSDSSSLAQQLKIVARLIAGGLKTSLYMVRIGSFDTHSNQVDSGDHSRGQHAQLLSELDDGIVAFLNDLRAHGVDDRVVGMTFSEFGRRITSNASGGTDHGAASPMFIFGNKVLGGVLGSNPVIPFNATNENNLDMAYDFRQVYASVLQQWFGATEEETGSILLNDFTTVPIIDNTVTALSPTETFRSLTVYPNPVAEKASVSFYSKGRPVRIDVVDAGGRTVSDVYTGTLPEGQQVVLWDAGALAAGPYIVRLRSEQGTKSATIIKR